jgi:hypothetical protein
MFLIQTNTIHSADYFIGSAVDGAQTDNPAHTLVTNGRPRPTIDQEPEIDEVIETDDA